MCHFVSFLFIFVYNNTIDMEIISQNYDYLCNLFLKDDINCEILSNLKGIINEKK